MDLTTVLEDLNAKKERVLQAIAHLERLQNPGAPAKQGSGRGRKSMGTAERQQVAERMRRYWAARRESKQPD